MLKFLNQPYQERSTPKRKLWISILIGLFIFLFIFLFKPFGFSLLPASSQLYISFGYGLITSLVVFIFAFLIDPLFSKRKNWTIGKNLILDIVMVSCIGIANFIFYIIVFNGEFAIQDLGLYSKYLFFSVWTAILIGIIPATITYLVSFNNQQKEILERISQSEDIPEMWKEKVEIKAGNLKSPNTFNPKNIVYISSNDNYICVVTLKGNDIHKTHIRGTLKAVEQDLKGNTKFLRCHKCYIVNEMYIARVVGNAQNMRFLLSIQGLEIPVSRSSAPAISKRFRDR